MAERRKRAVRPLWVLGALIAVLLLGFAFVLGPWLLTRHPQKGLTAEQALKAKNDVRTTLVQALAGLAVAGGALVTYRTFRQNQVEQDRSYALRQGEQVNALYTKAVEQLGHDQAPVRLGALYSLVHLAQANPDQRQTVVNVLCAYLRMPYTQPEELSASATAAEQRDASQELQVRLTAQRLLDDRLRAPDGVAGDEAQHLPPSPDEPFWPGIDLDLTGAVLINFSLFNASVGVAMFHKTIFSGATAFNDTTFTSIAWFGDAVFAGPTGFYDSTFRYARFPKAIFGGNTRFTGATFRDQGVFVEAIFNGEARFDKATFSGEARFDMATFSREVSFYKATFSGDTSSAFSQARVLYLDDPGLKMRRFWPDGWTVRPNGDDPTRGTLIREEQADQPRGDGGGATP